MTDLTQHQQAILFLFHTSQCSWCKHFYTNEPFSCPHRKLQSSCPSFDKLIEVVGWWTREEEAKKYLARILDMIQDVTDRGFMAKCRDPQCSALNPNPQTHTCWKCGKSLCCPQHPDLLLRYSIEGHYWKCTLTSHVQKFYEEFVLKPILADICCPKCSPPPFSNERPRLYYDSKSLFLKCEKCNRFFTYYHKKLKEVRIK